VKRISTFHSNELLLKAGIEFDYFRFNEKQVNTSFITLWSQEISDATIYHAIYIKWQRRFLDRNSNWGGSIYWTWNFVQCICFECWCTSNHIFQFLKMYLSLSNEMIGNIVEDYIHQRRITDPNDFADFDAAVNWSYWLPFAASQLDVFRTCRYANAQEWWDTLENLC